MSHFSSRLSMQTSLIDRMPYCLWLCVTSNCRLYPLTVSFSLIDSASGLFPQEASALQATFVGKDWKVDAFFMNLSKQLYRSHEAHLRVTSLYICCFPVICKCLKAGT